MELFIIGLATFLNLVMVIAKFKNKRIPDALVDGGVFVFTCWCFSGSYSALSVGTLASALISCYLFICPIIPRQKAIKKNSYKKLVQKQQNIVRKGMIC